MKLFRQKFMKEGAYHFLLWLLLIGPHSFFSSYLIDNHLELLLYCIMVADVLLIAIVYFVIYVLIPNYYLTKRYSQFIAYLSVLFALYVYACVKMETDISTALGRQDRLFHYFLYYFINICRYTLIGFLLFKLKQSIGQQKRLKQITVEKLQAEVNYLRAQINPHFLFNTLNNLYGLALQHSDKTADIIIRLSRMMDYMLYDVEGTKVPLQRDLENLENYIEMEKIRQGNHAKIQFQVKGAVTNQLIEPLLLLPLVENAFKHGVNQMIEGAYLEINLTVDEREIFLSVKNNYKSLKKNGQLHQSLGLTNLRKRLDLFYPGSHKLEIFDDSLHYHVTLTIRGSFQEPSPKIEETQLVIQ